MIIALGILSNAGPNGRGQAMVTAYVAPVDQGSELPELFDDRAALVMSSGCAELMYDVARRAIVSQAGLMDVQFAFDLKAPEVEVTPLMGESEQAG
ncbi:hypothetical protein C6401_11065 [Arthrobacter woluwensis]|nr:hypothetical protein C6401_11065 [Arthrobacter woluwensis]